VTTLLPWVAEYVSKKDIVHGGAQIKVTVAKMSGNIGKSVTDILGVVHYVKLRRAGGNLK